MRHPEMHLFTLGDYTPDEIIIESLHRLFDQGGLAYTPKRGWCEYRRNDGRKCAVGVLIRDEDYDSAIEGEGAEDALAYMGMELDSTRLQALAQLQSMHDAASSEDLDVMVRCLPGNPYAQDVARLLPQVLEERARGRQCGGGMSAQPYAGLVCRHCGPVDIDAAEYDRQMDLPDASWKCPACGRVAEFNDARFEELNPEPDDEEEGLI